MQKKIQLEKGIFLCSIDTEMAWGSAHRDMDPEQYEHWQAYGRVTEACERLLELMDRYEIRATWAFVGRLLIDPGDEQENSAYSANPQPARAWLSKERLGDRSFHSRWHAPDLLNKVQGAQVEHEIGSHTFSHVVAGENGYSRELLARDLQDARRQAGKLGIHLKSLVYPKNRIAHTDVAAEQGFASYRTVTGTWFDRLPKPLWRVAQKLDAYLPLPAQVSSPVRDGDMWVLPASYYYRHTGGWARWQSNLVRKAKLKSGIRRAAGNRSLFHVWFHPYDIASNPDRLLPPLETAFAEVARLRDRGRIDNLTMGDTADLLAGASKATSPAETVALVEEQARLSRGTSA